MSGSVTGQDPGQHRVADVGLDELGALEVAGRLGSVSMPAMKSIEGSRSSCRASSAPQWLAIPVMTTRLPGRQP